MGACAGSVLPQLLKAKVSFFLHVSVVSSSVPETVCLSVWSSCPSSLCLCLPSLCVPDTHPCIHLQCHVGHYDNGCNSRLPGAPQPTHCPPGGRPARCSAPLASPAGNRIAPRSKQLESDRFRQVQTLTHQLNTYPVLC